MTSFPIILFTYNRPDHTRLTVESVRRNIGAAESDLYVFCDGPKNDQHAEKVREVRQYLRGIEGFQSVNIVERDANLGLAKSIIAGTSQILEKHAACIVLEDDMLSAPNFLLFMNEALCAYRDRDDIFSVTGYNYPLKIPQDYPYDAYLSYRGSSWGWGTWADRWRKVDWAVQDYAQFSGSAQEQALFARGGNDLPQMLKLQMEGKIDSWAIRFDYAHHKHNAFCLHAVRPKIRNIGFDGSGVHCGVSDEYDVTLDQGSLPFELPADIALDPVILKAFDERFRPAPIQPQNGARTRLTGKLRRMRDLARGVLIRR
jgi:hypothetical protein